jgi:signal transduction histidine kinase
LQSRAYLGGRILLVDDEPSNVLVLERMLSREGYTSVVSTTDSRQALRLFHEARTDLVLLDLMMPHLDGFQVMEQIMASLPEESFVPILVLTADATPQALQRALSAGAKDFLTKPFDRIELLLRVKNLLETRFLYLAMQHQLESLETIASRAEAAVTSRDVSLMEISHDLGQPLAAVRLTTEALRQDLQEAPRAELQGLARDLDRIDSAAEQIAAMISELSDLARLQMGRGLVLHREPTDLVSLAKRLLDDRRKVSRRHKLKLQAPSALEGNWDRLRLQRVLSNLVSNAIKFSPSGGEVAVSIEAIDQDGKAAARLRVSDQGIGIPATDLPHIFDRFFRASNAVSLIEGSGIGLAGARQIVEHHGGSMELESEEGRGTTVIVTLPLEAASA